MVPEASESEHVSLTPRAARPVWQRLVVQFVVVGLLVAAALAWMTGLRGERLAQDQVIEDARTTTELLAQTVVEPSLSSGLLTPDAGDLDRFDRVIRSRMLSDDVVRVKIWWADGRIIYSDEPRLLGQTFELGADQPKVIAASGSNAEVADLSKLEDSFDQQLGQVHEVYPRVEEPGGGAALRALPQ
jgi:hypothetical protein